MTGKYISPTTLRRFWGYQEKEKQIKPSIFTLDLLSAYAGFHSWIFFYNNFSDSSINNSHLIFNKFFHSSSLSIGDIVWLSWNPNRKVKVRYLGNNKFIIEESINSKLEVGYTFECSTFIKQRPLLITNLSKNNSVPVIYNCGAIDGIDYYIEKTTK